MIRLQSFHVVVPREELSKAHLSSYLVDQASTVIIYVDRLSAFNTFTVLVIVRVVLSFVW